MALTLVVKPRPVRRPEKEIRVYRAPKVIKVKLIFADES